ncbi:MAG: GNAT family N-acetyltransferase [Planctomycetaceae bacterium]
MQYRFARREDASLLGELNYQLIRDEGHRNSMSPTELAERMSGWLHAGHHAVLFETEHRPAGYALFREEPEHVYVRQFFVCREFRRQGIGRQAMEWLRGHAWPDAARLRIDVLVGNAAGIAFWRAVGFRDYCLTMEATRPMSQPNLH